MSRWPARSMALWRELEAATGEPLFDPPACLVIGSLETAARHHGKPHFLRRTLAAAERFAIPHEVLAPGEARRRHPALRVGDHETVYFEPGAGTLTPERCIAASLAAAARDGATIRTGERVRAIETHATGVAVITDRDRHQAGQAIVCAGAWTATLLGETWPVRLALHRQWQHWFAPAEAALFAPERLPAFIWMHGEGETDWFYGFPQLDPGAGVKLARERFDQGLGDPDSVFAASSSAVADADARMLLDHHVGGRLAGLGNRRLRSAPCLYSVAPESRFAIGRIGERVFAVSACSGHGFKHSPAIGEAVADWALAGVAPRMLAPFFLADAGADPVPRL